MYTLQQDAKAGDLFALRWDGETITGYVGPLNARDALAIRDTLATVDYADDPAMLASLQATGWQPPIRSDALQDRRGWQGVAGDASGGDDVGDEREG